MTTLTQICDFLGSHRLAMVGVSHNSKDFTRTLFRAFLDRGYDAVPVHPGITEIDGHSCFAHVREISPPVDAALLLTSPAVTDFVVRDCAEAGVMRVWMYRATGAGAVSSTAVEFCEANGISVVAGECPFMFFPDAGLIHGLHRCVRKITGRYPR